MEATIAKRGEEERERERTCAPRRNESAPARRAGTLVVGAIDGWRRCGLSRQGSTGDGCSVRDLVCIVSVREDLGAIASGTKERERERGSTRTRRSVYPPPTPSLSLPFPFSAAHRLGVCRVRYRARECRDFRERAIPGRKGTSTSPRSRMCTHVRVHVYIRVTTRRRAKRREKERPEVGNPSTADVRFYSLLLLLSSLSPRLALPRAGPFALSFSQLLARAFSPRSLASVPSSRRRPSGRANRTAPRAAPPGLARRRQKRPSSPTPVTVSCCAAAPVLCPSIAILVLVASPRRAVGNACDCDRDCRAVASASASASVSVSVSVSTVAAVASSGCASSMRSPPPARCWWVTPLLYYSFTRIVVCRI